MKPNIEFSYSVQSDKQFLANLVVEREWFAKTGVKTIFPKTIAEGERFIKEDAADMHRRMRHLGVGWNAIENQYFDIVGEFRYKKLLKKYQCQITQFGCEGQYRPPNTVIVRLHTKSDERSAVETIGHEVLHLCFHNYFKQKRFGYAEREGMVDELILQSPLRKLFPRYPRQSVGKLRPKLLASILNLTD